MQASSLSLTSEFAFVVGMTGALTVGARADDVNDWQLVLDIALEHRVLPRVWRNAAALMPQPHAQRMYEHALRITQNALQNIQRTIEVVQLFERHGITAIVLKGPLLAQRLYGDLGLRMCSDVDLLVRSEDLLRASQLLSANGYHHHTALNTRSLQLHRKVEHDVAFAHPDDGTLIELHADIAQPHYSYRVDLNAWWLARETAWVGGVRLPVLAVEHAYLLLVMHAARHQWSRLDLIADIAAFQKLALDRALVTRVASTSGISRLVELSESLAALFYGEAPARMHPITTKLANSLIEGRKFGRWDGAWLDVLAREGTADQLRYIIGRFVRRPFFIAVNAPFARHY